MAGQFVPKTGSSPATPSAGYGSIFADSADLLLKYLDENGVLSMLTQRQKPNLLRNSGMWFCQRQGAAAVNSGSLTLRANGLLTGCDGWGIWNENANTTYARTDTSSAPETGLQGRYYGTFNKVTSTGKFFVSQMLEANDSQAVRGRTVRFQAWLKSSTSQTTRLGLVQLNSAGTVDTLPATFISAAGAAGTDPTLGTNLAYIAPKAGVTGDNCTLNGNAYDCSTTTSWQRFGGVFDVPEGAKNLLPCVWTNTGLAASTSLSMSQASLTDGYEVQGWLPLSYAQELHRVQRYFSKTFAPDTAPAASAGANTGEFHFISTVTGAAAQAGAFWPFPVRMRASPNVLALFNPAAAGAQVRNVADAADCTGSTVTACDSNGCWITTTGAAGLAPGENLAVHIYAGAEGSNNEFA